MWITKRSANVIFWKHIFLFGLTLAKDTRDVSSVIEVKTEVIYVSQTKPSFVTIWDRHWFSKILSSRQSSNCGSGLLSCDVEDPTRLEAPWHGIAAPFPQCYDPAAYVCSENFLCPVGAPKIEGQYACGPYTSAQVPSSTGNSESSSNTTLSQPASEGGGCGLGTLLCEVEDPTRLEAPWHGVSAPFPQCYDPALYTCSDNFLCPICAPKIPGQYACGPYISPCPQTPGSGGGTGTITPSSSSFAQTSSSLSSSTAIPSESLSSSGAASTSIPVGSPSSSSTSSMSRSSTTQSVSFKNSSSTSSTQSSTNSGSVTTILPTTETLPNGSLTTISGTSETLPTNVTGQGGSVTVIPPSVSTKPNGSLTTISGTTETLPTGFSGTGSITIIPPSVSTEPNGSLTTISGTTETIPTGSGGSGVGSVGSVTTIAPSVSTKPNGSLTTISGSTETLPTGFSPGPGGSVTTIPPSVSTEPNGSLTTISGTIETLPTGSDTASGGSVTIIPPSVSTEPDGSLSTISGTTETLPTSPPQTSVPGGIIIGGSTFGFPASSELLTEPGGQTITLGPSGIVIGSDTISFPSVTAPTTLTSDGLTFTLEPGGVNTAASSSPTSEIVLDGSTFTIGASFQTVAEPDGSTIVIGPSNVVVGSNTIPFPSPGATLTTDGITLGEITAAPSSAFSTSNPPGSTGPLPVFSTWPSGISVSAETTGPITTGTVTTGTHIYVTTSSSNSQGSSSPFVIWIPHFPCLICGCWFCPPGSSGFDFFGFLEPGIYPPPPPGIRPPGFSSDFPSVTIGYDGNPTYSSEPESDKQTSTTATSSSSCSTITATDCTDFVSYGVNTAGSTTASATSSLCNTVTSCSASAFTTTTFTTASCTVSSACSTVTSCPALFGRQVKRQACATSTACSPASTACPGAPTNYIIYPANQDAVGVISNTLSNDFKIEPSLILTAQSQYLGFNYWAVPLTPAQYNSLNGNHLVGAMYPECTENCYDPSDDALTLADSAAESYPNRKRDILNLTDTEIYSKLQKRNGGLVRQAGAADELVHISLGPNLELGQQSHNYVYDRTGGAGSTVYIVDTGANLANPEFPNGKEFKEPRWIFAGTSTSRLEEDTGIQNNPLPPSTSGGGGVVAVGNGPGHGTAMLSKVSGDTVGIAKSTNNVVVVCPATVKAECYQDALTKIYDDIRNNGVTNAVVLMAVYFDPNAPGVTATWITALRNTMNDLANIGAIVVTGAGNGKLPEIRGYPASFALKTLPPAEQVPTLIVASGTDAYGTIATMFGGAIILPNRDPNIDLVWAPGYQLTVADARYNLRLPNLLGGGIAGAYRSGSGTSESAASVAGLCAYFLGLTDIDADIRPGPNPIDNAAAMKAYLLRESFQRLAPANIPTVWNGVTTSEEFKNANNCPLRVGKRQSPGPDYATCSATSSSTTTTSSSATTTSSSSTTTSSSSTTTSSSATTTSTCSTSTVSICTETITFGVNQGSSTTMTASSQSCSPTVGCSVTGFTSTIRTTMTPTITTFISCSNQDEDPGLGINSGFCVCSGSTFSQSVNTITTPANSCAYTTLPSVTLVNPTTTFPVTTNTAACQVCTQVGPNEDNCTPIPNCTTQPPPVSTGIAIADFYACPNVGNPCAHQWEIFPVVPPTNTYPGCSTDGALYSTVVTTVPVATAVPTLGPFNVNGYNNCYYDGKGGLSCNSQAKCVVCEAPEVCARNYGVCDVFGVTANGAGYQTDLICTW